jgi:uncharacterized membrane protein YfcA
MIGSLAMQAGDGARTSLPAVPRSHRETASWSARFKSVAQRVATVDARRAALAAVLLWAAFALCVLGADIADGDAQAVRITSIAAIIAVSALLSSIAGFAFSAIAGSALAYLGVAPVEAVATMVACSIAIQLYAVCKLRAHIRWRGLVPSLAGGAATVPAGVWLLTHVDATLYVISLGVFLTCYGAYAVLRSEARIVAGSATRDLLVGAVGGIAGGFAGSPGIFMTIWCSMRGWDKTQQRAFYQPYILVMQIVAIACLRAASATVHPIEPLRYVPFALLGAVAGLALFERLTTRQFQALVSALLMVSGVGLLCRAL